MTETPSAAPTGAEDHRPMITKNNGATYRDFVYGDDGKCTAIGDSYDSEGNLVWYAFAEPTKAQAAAYEAWIAHVKKGDELKEAVTKAYEGSISADRVADGHVAQVGVGRWGVTCSYPRKDDKPKGSKNKGPARSKAPTSK